MEIKHESVDANTPKLDPQTPVAEQDKRAASGSNRGWNVAVI